MDIQKILNAMRTSGQPGDFASLQFPNKWGVKITPSIGKSGEKWDVHVLHEGSEHYRNDIAQGAGLYGQLDHEVDDICQRVMLLGRLEDVEHEA